MINILIADDSPTDAAILRYLIESEADMCVVAVAKNGQEAIDLTKKLNPDLVTMDLQMPVVDGFTAIKRIMHATPVPIVVVSSVLGDKELNATFLALEAGALAALDKPQDVTSPEFAKAKRYFLDTLRSMAQIKVITHRKLRKSEKEHTGLVEPITVAHQGRRHFDVVAIGASVGGPQALKVILSELPPDFPAPIVVVQHMTYGFVNGFAKWLNDKSQLNVRVALHNEQLHPGTVYLAPDKYHLTINRIDGKLITTLIKGEAVSGFCPSISVLFHSIAVTCGKNAMAVLLTGMGNDGAQGMLDLKRLHGHTIIQDRESAVVFGMAAVAQTLGAVENVVELELMAEYLKKICQ